MPRRRDVGSEGCRPQRPPARRTPRRLGPAPTPGEPMKIRHALTATLLVGLASRLLPEPLAEAEGTDCDITYTRTACPRQEAKSYEKCDGKQSCTKHVAAASEAQCLEAAIKACANDRLDITQSK